MDEPFDLGEAGAARALDADRERIDAQLRKPHSPRLESMLLAERRWVGRQQRALERKPVSCPAVLRAGSTAMTVQVRDISALGAGFEVEHPPPVGARVRLEFPELPGRPWIEATVRHASGQTHRAGVEFLERGEAARKLADDLLRRFGV